MANQAVTDAQEAQLLLGHDPLNIEELNARIGMNGQTDVHLDFMKYGKFQGDREPCGRAAVIPTSAFVIHLREKVFEK